MTSATQATASLPVGEYYAAAGCTLRLRSTLFDDEVERQIEALQEHWRVCRHPSLTIIKHSCCVASRSPQITLLYLRHYDNSRQSTGPSTCFLLTTYLSHSAHIFELYSHALRLSPHNTQLRSVYNFRNMTSHRLCITRCNKMRNLTLDALLYAFCVAQGLTHLFGRQRPNTTFAVQKLRKKPLVALAAALKMSVHFKDAGLANLQEKAARASAFDGSDSESTELEYMSGSELTDLSDSEPEDVEFEYMFGSELTDLSDSEPEEHRALLSTLISMAPDAANKPNWQHIFNDHPEYWPELCNHWCSVLNEKLDRDIYKSAVLMLRQLRAVPQANPQWVKVVRTSGLGQAICSLSEQVYHADTQSPQLLRFFIKNRAADTLCEVLDDWVKTEANSWERIRVVFTPERYAPGLTLTAELLWKFLIDPQQENLLRSQFPHIIQLFLSLKNFEEVYNSFLGPELQKQGYNLYSVKPESLYAQFIQYLTGVRGKLDQLLKHNDFLKTIISATLEGREKR
ncbi:hypothetical protein GGX14DRAFT_388886, partial [Mycena pura]